MNLDRIATLLRPHVALSRAQLESVSMYIDMLQKWNARINLTAVSDPEAMVTRHFGESFFVAARVLSPPPVDVIDVGSGAGFPGLPMAIFEGRAQIMLIEANTKKAAFLGEVIGALKLRNARVFCGRAEDYSRRAALVTMRAVEKFEKALPVALSLVDRGGRIALMVGRSQEGSAQRLAPGFQWEQSVSLPGSEARVLLVGTKLVKVE
ncbi:MAG TPA: 16S rRNA (guanine(527)-N(7))-methyltransferase RsmG [Candidatus Angelobacter sp.]|nr:16S rRNA (guanine(527)-N(7))-methyltransferase RsmG [Candidatus Angelobacter sp.]